MLDITKLDDLLSPVVSVYHEHITSKQRLNLPYVVILEMSSENIFADNRTLKQIIPIQVILHQSSRDRTLEESIKEVFYNNHIPYNCNTEWDRNNLLYATTFDING